MAPVTTESTAPEGDTWTGICAVELPTGDVSDWLVRSDCGASVVFTGTTRDHSAGRSGVTGLTYEAWEAQVGPRLEAVATELRNRWPDAARVALLHRTGEVPLGAAAVVVGVSAAHRDVAFEAARFGIDAVKASVPIWKREHHGEGSDWGLDGAELAEPSDVPSAWTTAGANA